MSKGLEALKEIGMNYARVFKARENGKKQFVHDYLIIEKELKALEIIKDKRVNVEWLLKCFKDYDLETYNTYQTKPLTQEEYDLLKEVLL